MNVHLRSQRNNNKLASWGTEIIAMVDQIPSEQLLPRRRLSTIGEDDDVGNRRTVGVVFKMHPRSAARRMPENERKDSQVQSSVTGAKLRRRRFAFTASLRAAYSESFSESPLKGTPWEDAALNSVSLASASYSTGRNRKRRLQRSAKEEESIDFCLKLFGKDLEFSFICAFPGV